MADTAIDDEALGVDRGEDAAGAPWVYADAVLAALVAAAPFLAAAIPGDREGTRDGIRYASAALCAVLMLPALELAMRAAPETAPAPATPEPDASKPAE